VQDFLRGLLVGSFTLEGEANGVNASFAIGRSLGFVFATSAAAGTAVIKLSILLGYFL
jgi:hypothetical protein